MKMSYETATVSSANYAHRQGSPIEATNLSASAANLADRLDGVLDTIQRLNIKIHGPEPKAASTGLPPRDSEPPLSRAVDRAHRLISEIDQELTALESRL
jgi:hypothetical protein